MFIDQIFFFRFRTRIVMTIFTKRYKNIHPELNIFEWDILNLEIDNNKRYLISRLRKRVNQALIPISNIQKFPAQRSELFSGETLILNVRSRNTIWELSS